MGDGRIFLNNLRETSINKDLSNEPNFGLIHLAGQYLQPNRDLEQLMYKRQALKISSGKRKQKEVPPLLTGTSVSSR
jgi:hypothetical protein